MRKRPSPKELSKKIHAAIESLSIREGFFAEPSKNLGELDKLSIETQDLWPLILQLLMEIKPENYTGSRPPQKSYEAKIASLELFAFSWESKTLNRKMYLKFVIRNNFFYLVSLHEDKPLKKGGN